MPAARQFGIVRSFDGRTGYGFILSDSGNDNIFLHATDMVDHRDPYRGARVEFHIGVGLDRRRRATQVRII
jgi:cold shock CspA family protein